MNQDGNYIKSKSREANVWKSDYRILYEYAKYHNPDLSYTAWFVHSIIKNLQDNGSQQECFCSNRYLSDMLPNKNDKRTVMRAINELVKCGLVKKIKVREKRYLEVVTENELIKQDRAGGDKNVTAPKAVTNKNKLAGGDGSVTRGGDGSVTHKDYKSSYYKNSTFSKEKSSEVCSDKSEHKAAGSFNGLKPLPKKNKLNPKLNKTKLHDLASREKTDNTKPDILVSDKIQELLDIWFKHTGKKHKKNSANFAQTVKDLKALQSGLFFGKHKCEETKSLVGKKINTADFELAIVNFALARSDKDYYPVKKQYLQNLNLRSFLFNDYSKTTRCYFAKYLEPPQKLPSQNIDKHPDLTKWIIETYRTKVLGGLKYSPNLIDETKFISASDLLSKFFIENKSRLNGSANYTTKQKAELLFKAVLSDLGSNKIKHISPGYFCSDTTFSQRLPRYMYANALITEPMKLNNGGTTKRKLSPLEPGYLKQFEKGER